MLQPSNLRKISPEMIKEIEMATKVQSANSRWFSERECRITASWFYEAIHNKDPHAKALSHIYPSKFTSRSTSHGKKYEPAAVAKYAKINPECTISTSGLVVLESHPFLGASPDFLINDDGLGEVKCPYTSKNSTVNPCHQTFLKYSKKSPYVLKLKKDHKHYYRVQGQLMITGRQYCDFFVYTLEEMKVIRILRNESFISLMLLDLVQFFDNYFCPALVNKY